MTPNEIIDACAYAWGITKKDILGKNRQRSISSAKHFARHLMSKRLGMSSTQIAKVFGCTHATVLHSFQQVNAWNIYREDELPELVLASVAERILKNGRI